MKSWALDGNETSNEANLPNLFLNKPFVLTKYFGTWHEIGRFPLIWEERCKGAEAIYRQGLEPNTMSVENICLVSGSNTEGKSDTNSRFSRTAIARVDPEYQDVTKLILTFNDNLPSDGPATYWILDTNYANYALVGNASKTHLWVLSRQTHMSQCLAIALAERLRTEFGYDTNKILWHANCITPCVTHSH